MCLERILAIPHPSGNRIDLSWVNLDPEQYPGVCVVRRESTYPSSPEDGEHVYSGELTFATDRNLKGETVYYYSLFPYRGDPPQYKESNGQYRAAAMTSAPYDMAGQMYALLPRIYHRYDTTLPTTTPHGMAEADRQRGQLRRFLDLPGGQLDQLYSYARAMLDLYDIDKVDGRLLPLLARWIGWETNHRLGFDTQRNEIRNAPAIYQRIGIIPTVEATIKRIFGWESRTKEFVHNVFRSNCPEQLNLWARYRRKRGEWSEPAAPLSLDFAYEGRPAAVRDTQGTLGLFYHTRRIDRWDIWYKTLSTFGIAPALQRDLEDGVISADLRQAFADAGFPLSHTATIEKQHSEWQISDADHDRVFTVVLADGQLNVYRWTPSQRLTNRPRIDKHPTAAIQEYGTEDGKAETLWLFWDSYDETSRTWRIDYQRQTRQPGGDWPGEWSLATFGGAGRQPERRQPWAVADDAAGLWLFWLEKDGGRWQVKYNRHKDARWEFEEGQAFPLDHDGRDPGMGGDLFVLFESAALTPDSKSRLWVFWTYKTSVGQANQTRRQIAYRTATYSGVLAWSAIATLPKEAPGDYDDCEPAAFLNADGNVELFWSSNRDGSWSIWHSTLLEVAPLRWASAERVTAPPYSQRDPLPTSIAANTWLIYRSNRSLRYASAVYGATETLDTRYAGCTTVDTRNVAKIALRRQFDDFQTYAYDVGQAGIRTGRNWYARDTVGIYLTPTAEDPLQLYHSRDLITSILRQFLPIQVRTVFIIELAAHDELVYTYEFRGAEPQRLIGERVFDSTIPETYPGLGEDYQDTVPGWVWIHSWSTQYPDHLTVDTRYRTWHVGLKAGG
jgi:hypothetical protein